MTADAKPACPDHPKAAVLAARKPGETRRQWICLDCGKQLGDAGPAETGEWESQTVSRGERQ